MPRVKRPNPWDLIQAYKRKAAVDIEQVDDLISGIHPVHRVYDRSSGNFKAVGWFCQIYFRHIGGVAPESDYTVILDSEINPFTQSALPSGD